MSIHMSKCHIVGNHLSRPIGYLRTYHRTFVLCSYVSAMYYRIHERIQRWGQRVRTPVKNYNNIVNLAILVRIPLKITKLPSQHSILGHRQHASKMPLKWRFAGGPMKAPFQWYLGTPSPHNKVVKVGPLCQNFLDSHMRLSK